MKKILCVLLLLSSIGIAQDYEWYWIDDFSGGLRTDLSPTLVPKNCAIQLDNAIIEGTSLRLRPGYSVWTTRIDSLTDGSVPSPVRGVRNLYEFYNDITDEKQIMAVIHDEVWWKSDDSTSFRRLGIQVTDGLAVLADNDTIVYYSYGDWLTEILPEDGDDWNLYLYTAGGTYSWPVYRLLSNNHLKLDEANTDGSFVSIENFALVPTFDTINNVHFSTAGRTCFISDGTHPVRKWVDGSLDNYHYIIDSAVVASVSYGTWNSLETITVVLGTPLTQSSDIIDLYGTAHYAMVYDIWQGYPFDEQEAIMRSSIVYAVADTLILFADLTNQYSLGRNQTIYVVPPMSEGYSFAVDTIYSGIVDSMIQYDTVATRPADSILTQIGIDTLGAGTDSITIDLGISYTSISGYQVIFSYGDVYESRVMVRKVATDQFRFIRPPVDNVPQQILNWIAVGQAVDTDSADGATYGSDWLWQWGQNMMAPGSGKDTVDLTYMYSGAEEYVVMSTPFRFYCGQNAHPAYITNHDANTFYYNSESYGGSFYRWLVVGDPNIPGEANSGEDGILIQWDVDTLLPDERNIFQTQKVYFEKEYSISSYQMGVASVDSNIGYAQDTIENRLVVAVTTARWFELKRIRNSVAQYVAWLAIGPCGRASSDTNHMTLVYDQDVFIDDTIRNDDLFTAPYIFKVIEGPTVNESWWANGVPCTFYMTDDDTLTLRVLAPTYDYDGNVIVLPPTDSAQYVVLKLEYYPPVSFTNLRQNRMWFSRSTANPNTMWFSKLEHYAGLVAANYFDDVSTANYKIIGTGDNDEIMGVSLNQQWLIIYKRHSIYVLSNNDVPFDVYERSRNYGLWASGTSVPYMHNDFGLHRYGVFGFDGSSVTNHNHISMAVSPFFVDSLNLSQIDMARGELYRDYLMLSIPTGSFTKNDETLVLDTRTGAWMTWSFAMGSVVSRRAPGSLDTLLWGSPDSATIFVMGGTDDAGTEIEMTWQSPYLDFDKPTWKKQLRKVAVTCQANSGCSLSVAVYADDLLTAEYQDTVVCDTLLGYHSPQLLVLDLPGSIESTTRYSVKLTSIAADSLKIDKIDLQYYKTEEVGAQ